MRWSFYIMGGKRAEMLAIAEELAPAGYRLRSATFNRRTKETLMVLTKLATYNETDLFVEIRRLNALFKRRKIFGLDCVDVEDPKYDDRSVN